jgi:hypothetical protein
MNTNQFNEIKARNAARTQGKWYWQKPAQGISVRLYTPSNGHCIVMDFVRRGTQGAQPRFSDRGNKPLGGIMHSATEIDLDQNPDAVFIAMASTDIPALIAEIERLRAGITDVLIQTPGQDAMRSFAFTALSQLLEGG